MRAVAVIPARMGSSRFPGKPLAPIHGVPMVGHVYARCTMSHLLEQVAIATCDDAIRAYADAIGAPCIMTAPTHQRASDRTAEALTAIEQELGHSVDVVVMVQGDEPMVHPSMLEEALRPFQDDPSIQVVNLMSPLKTRADCLDPNQIKVVVDRSGRALYFSRAPIPAWRTRGAAQVAAMRQICVIPFRRDFLLTFSQLEPTALEQAESIDMLRALEHGYDILMVPSAYETRSVDTQDDLARVERLMADDPLLSRYPQPCQIRRGEGGTRG